MNRPRRSTAPPPWTPWSRWGPASRSATAPVALWPAQAQTWGLPIPSFSRRRARSSSRWCSWPLVETQEPGPSPDGRLIRSSWTSGASTTGCCATEPGSTYPRPGRRRRPRPSALGPRARRPGPSWRAPPPSTSRCSPGSPSPPTSARRPGHRGHGERTRHPRRPRRRRRRRRQRLAQIIRLALRRPGAPGSSQADRWRCDVVGAVVVLLLTAPGFVPAVHRSPRPGDLHRLDGSAPTLTFGWSWPSVSDGWSSSSSPAHSLGCPAAPTYAARRAAQAECRAVRHPPQRRPGAGDRQCRLTARQSSTRPAPSPTADPRFEHVRASPATTPTGCWQCASPSAEVGSEHPVGEVSVQLAARDARVWRLELAVSASPNATRDHGIPARTGRRRQASRSVTGRTCSGLRRRHDRAGRLPPPPGPPAAVAGTPMYVVPRTCVPSPVSRPDAPTR